MAVVLTAFAVLVGSGFAVFAFARSGGASSPEAAVRQLFDALDQEDAAGVLEVLPPSERDVIKPPVLDILQELQRLGILSDVPAEQVPGADIEVRDLSLSEEPVGTNDDLKAVRVLGGQLVAHTVPAAVPVGPTLRAIIEQDLGETIEIDDQSDTEDLAKGDLRLITVNEGGGWHVSLFYSIAEAARDGKGAAPVLGGGPAPVGADSPEGAVRGLVDGAVALDLERVITMLPPDEARALYDYAPLFLPEVSSAAADARDDGFSLQVTDLSTSVEGDGDTRRVKITGFAFEGGDDKSNGSFRWDGSCFTMDSTSTYRSYSYDYDDDDDEFDPDDPSTWEPPTTTVPREPTTKTRTDHYDSCDSTNNESSDPDASPSGDPLFGELDVFGSVRPDLAIVVVERDGRWYVSPVRTVFDSILSSLRSLTPEQLRSWAQALAEQQEQDERIGPSGSGRIEPVPGTLVPVPPGEPGEPGEHPGTVVPGDDGGLPQGATTTTRPRTTTTRVPPTATTAPGPTTTDVPAAGAG